MAQTSTLTAAPRTASGKGGARSLRRQGQIPAVIYGRGREPEALSVDGAILERLLQQIRASTTVLDVHVSDRKPVKALIREIQRDPVRAAIIHLDLYEIHAGEAITLEVPIKFAGTAEGVRNSGGVFEVISHHVEIKVLPADIPEHIEIDVTELSVGQSLHVRNLILGSGEILTDGGITICTVGAPKIEEEPVEAVAEEEEETAEPELIRKPKADDDEDETDGE